MAMAAGVDLQAEGLGIAEDPMLVFGHEPCPTPPGFPTQCYSRPCFEVRTWLR